MLEFTWAVETELKVFVDLVLGPYISNPDESWTPYSARFWQSALIEGAATKRHKKDVRKT